MITFYSCLHLYDFWHPCPLFRGFTADQFEHNHGSIAHYDSPATSYAHNATQLRWQGWSTCVPTRFCDVIAAALYIIEDCCQHKLFTTNYCYTWVVLYNWSPMSIKTNHRMSLQLG